MVFSNWKLPLTREEALHNDDMKGIWLKYSPTYHKGPKLARCRTNYWPIMAWWLGKTRVHRVVCLLVMTGSVVVVMMTISVVVGGGGAETEAAHWAYTARSINRLTEVTSSKMATGTKSATTTLGVKNNPYTTTNEIHDTFMAHIPQYTSPISLNALFCNRNVYMLAQRNVYMCLHFCYKIMHCGTFV